MPSILFGVVKICCSLFKRYYLKEKKLALSFALHFWNFQQILNVFKKKMTVPTNISPILQTVKDLVRPVTKKRRFRTYFDSQHVKLLKHLWNLHESTYIFSSLWGKIVWTMSSLVKFEILGVFVNTLTANDKYPVRD